MKITRLPILISMLVLVLSILACEGSFNTASIADAWMSTDEAGDARNTVFTPEAVFYAQVDLRNAPDDTLLKAVWTAVEVEDTEPDLMIEETEFTTGSGLIHFELSNLNLWPDGRYKVEIYLNGELAKTLEFEVR